MCAEIRVLTSTTGQAEGKCSITCSSAVVGDKKDAKSSLFSYQLQSP